MADAARGTPASLGMQLLAGGLPGSIALLVSRDGDRHIVEESVPASSVVGHSLRMPPGLIASEPVEIDAARHRVPLEWTELLGGRPAHFAAAPIDGRNLHLVVASLAKGPNLRIVRRWAEVVDRQLLRGEPTARRIAASRRVATLIDNLPTPLVFVDARSIEVFINGQARTLLDIRGGAHPELDVRAALMRMVAIEGDGQAATLARDPHAPLLFRIAHVGRHIEVDSRWIEAAELTGRLWLFRDVTDEHQLAQFKDELVSTVSHELRTPLTSILGALTLLRDGKAGALDAASAGLVDVAWRNGQRLLRLVGDLLDLDKLGAHKLEIDRRPTRLAALVTEAIAQNRPLAERRAIRLSAEIQAEDAVASIDLERMLQVMGNLLSNAIKFSHDGGEVRVALMNRATYSRIAVSDDGPGVPAEFRDRLFTRFAQARTAVPTGQAGTGLGLAICKAIVEEHGGAIALDASRTEGATFFVDLPATWAG
jgi:signal transduction histidine kinase